MKIAILGGGFAGLTAAYYLQKDDHDVTVIERQPVLGGLASGFNPGHWEWPLERAYHHLFASDRDILDFARDVGFDKIYFRAPESASLYKVGNNYRIFPLDTPQDFFRFPLLSLPDKLRGAATLAFLRYTPHMKFYERTTAEEFLKTTMGENSWNILWKQLFRKKFGKYAENITTSFFWARISKRTKQLGYIQGGFQTFIDYLEHINIKNDVVIKKNTTIKSVEIEGERFVIKSEGNEEIFDAVISTLPTPVLTKVASGLFTDSYLEKLRSLEYLSAMVLVLETEHPILKSTYWLNISTPEIPMMFVGQHTNFVDPQHYGDRHLAYIGYYLENEDPLMKKTKEELITYLSPHLKTISGSTPHIINSYHWRAPYAQPIFNKTFVANRPDFVTPRKNFYIANLDMTFPYDRGTNYAVALGKKVAEMI